MNCQLRFIKCAAVLLGTLSSAGIASAQATTSPPAASKSTVSTPAASSTATPPPAVSNASSSSQASTAAPAVELRIQDIAELLAGKVPEPGLPTTLKNTVKWKSYGQAVQTTWDQYSQKIGVPMMQWAKTEVPEVKETVFYPFSGPDFTTVYQLFPNAKRYVMMAMQSAERPLNLGALSPAVTDKNLDLLTGAWKQFGSHGFFVTEYLDKYLYTTQAQIGASTFLTTFLNLHGFKVERVVPIGVRSDGEIEELPSDTKPWRSVRFNVTKDGRKVILDYLKVDLSNEGLTAHPANLELVRREAANPVMFKAASHLPQNENFSMVAKEISDRTPLIVQDETALKYSSLINTFSIALYGKFTIPHQSFKSYHGDLAKAFSQRNDIKPLPFRFGYFKDGNYAIMIATRK